MTLDNENLDIVQPDPEWDYYPLWHSLRHIKAKIDVALNLIKIQEYASEDIDHDLRNLLEPTSNKLIEIVNDLPVLDEE